MVDQQRAPDANAPLHQKLSFFLERFKALPKNVQYAIFGVFGVFLLLWFTNSGPTRPPVAVQPVPPIVTVQQTPSAAAQNEEDFQPVSPDRASLRRGFVTQQTQALQQIRTELEKQSETQQKEFEHRTQELQQLQTQLQETLKVLSKQMTLIEESNQRQRDEISRLAEDARRQGIQTKEQLNQQEIKRRTPTRISETRLSNAGNPSVGSNNALLQGITGSALRRSNSNPEANGGANLREEAEPLPFIPPLGFIRGTLLNGVDALAGSGLATPSLVRLSGVYKTAMNSTVMLDGCFMLVEFEGDISTERARGAPSRMTCVYPDRGAVTYDVAGYVVDAEDGLEGVPGLFYEGDSGRIALALAAEFASGVAQLVSSNQTTTSVGTDGTGTTFLTGNQTRSAIAGGVSNATSRLTSFLLERAERITPFIRIDALRKINVVLLSGTELRAEGSAWSLLFDAEKADLAKRSNN